ncbi:hypothetical protein FF38_05911 [Lucilia cuprina]|uniref:XRCC4 N-terminal domain-containing protein n=1 Tax=Lucilia cuprina TaxID=7375 RepID=A0A0L0CSH1_LUCCU|nr:hypothetical protein CVS40_7594 [Lucilia cuprina]KNC34349.1 hypothetical protein FF38_05911 [Lucilia cuprina]
MSSVTINKLLKTSQNSGDNKNYIYLQIKWGDEENNVKILDSESGKSYQGIVTVTAMKEIASNLDMSYNDYYEEMRSALTTYLALPGFYYKLEPEMQVLNIWKSQPESIPILYLDIDIKEIRTSNDILDSAIELLQQQDKSLTDRVQKAHKFDENSRKLLEDYRLCVEEKNELERKLLKKVAVLLNAKKERIAHLEERLKKYEEVEDNDDSEENEEGPQSTKKRRLVVRDSESDDDDEYMADTQPLTLPNDETNN